MNRPLREAPLPVRRLPSALVQELTLAPAVESEVHVPPAPTPEQIRDELERTFSGELAELREAARARGYQEGREAAACELERAVHAAEENVRAAEARREMEHEARLESLNGAFEHVNDLMARIDAAHVDAIADLEPLAVEIAFESLTRLLGRVEHYRTALSEIVAQAVSDVARHGEGIRIALHPYDAELMQNAGQGRPWIDRIVGDPSLSPGSCIVEAGPRCLDASLSRQLQELQRCLQRACEDRHSA